MRNGAKTGARPLVGGPFSKTPVFMCLCVRVHGAFFFGVRTRFFGMRLKNIPKKSQKKRQKIKQICQLFSIIRFCFRLSFFMSSVLEKR